jgi:hypothetical protein
MNKSNKDIFIYWGSVLSLLAVIGLLYARNQDQQKTIIRGHNVSNRQIELINMSYEEKIQLLEKELEELKSEPPNSPCWKN